MEKFKDYLNYAFIPYSMIDEEDEDSMKDIDPDYYEDLIHMNWSVWDHDKAEMNDRFFMVRVGEGNTGIVMAGWMESEPYRGEDWSGKGREVYYMDMDTETVIDTDLAPYISTEQLMKEIPGFDWTGGHSGRILDDEKAEKLERIWTEYLYANPDIFDGKQAYSYYDEEMANEELKRNLMRTRSLDCEVCGYNFEKIWGKDCGYGNTFKIFPPIDYLDTCDSDKKRTRRGAEVWKHIHCLCDNCQSVDNMMLRQKLGEVYYEKDVAYKPASRTE